MKRFCCKKYIPMLTLLFTLSLLILRTQTALAAEEPVVTSVSELTEALANADEGDTILVGDITFKPMPMGMIVVPKSVTIRSGLDTNAVFTNATFALNGTTSDSAPLTVNFENIDFRGDNFGNSVDPDSPPTISATMPGIMKTMCAAIFKMNVNASYTGCTFEGYHYGYGGIFNAIYSSADNINALNIALNDCVFRNNASKYGGSIYLSGYNHNINLDARHCIFDGNAATTGGAIWAENSNIHLLDCSLTGNQYLEAEVNEPNGGALALYTCGVDLDGCLIANNTSAGDGAGVFCEISPFKTLIMENCTVIGNSAPADEGITVSLAQTNFDTSAIAHIYFSALFGEQNFADNVELFGCLIVRKDVAESEPSEDNNYCLEITPETAEEMGLLPDTPEHVTLPLEEYPIPEEAIAKIAGGKFADSIGTLQVGDNYAAEAIIEVEETPGDAKEITIAYGDTLPTEAPTREGFSFEGWEYPEGTPVESEQVFIGGELPSEKMTAVWHFDLKEHLYVIWGPILLLAIIALIALTRRSRKPEDKPVAPSDTDDTEKHAEAPSEDRISRICENNELSELLSKRELEVLRKLLAGKSRKQIADELFVTEATIKKHSASIYSKLGVHNRTELVCKINGQ